MSSEPVALPRANRREHWSSCTHGPERFWDDYLESFDPTVGRAAAAAFEGIQRLFAGDLTNLLLSGPPGCGKSMLAAIACNELADFFALEAEKCHQVAHALEAEHKAIHAPTLTIDDDDARQAWYRERDARSQAVDRARRDANAADRDADRKCPEWIAVPTFLGRVRREIKGPDLGTADELTRASSFEPDLVVLDDIGAEKASEWTASTLFEIVGARYDAGRRLLITSNRTPAELRRMGYERIVSRMADNGAVIEMKSATDFRQGLRKPVTV